jgi:replicative DNA helicase
MWLNNYLEAENAQLENALLVKMLVSKRLVPDILPDYFTGRQKRLYEAMVDCWDKVSEVDVAYLKAVGFDGEIAIALEESGTSSARTINELHTLWQKRAIAQIIFGAAHGYADEEELTPEQVIRRIQEGASKILLKNEDKKYNHYDYVTKLSDLITENDNHGEIVGYSTGLFELDKYTSGIEKGNTYAIGACKKTGKSRFAVALAIELRKQGLSIVWNALEMSLMKINLCALANYSGIDTAKLGKKLFKEDMVKAQVAINDLLKLDWKIIRERTTAGLRARVVDLKSNGPIDVVIVDYIQRMQDNVFKGERAQEVEAISKALADMAGELDIAMIILSQFGKEAERLGKNEIPNMTHLKESQGLAESADCIITLHNPARSENPVDFDGSYTLPEITCLVEQRYGLSGARFKILGDLRICKFLNHDKPYG